MAMFRPLIHRGRHGQAGSQFRKAAHVSGLMICHASKLWARLMFRRDDIVSHVDSGSNKMNQAADVRVSRASNMEQFLAGRVDKDEACNSLLFI